MNKNKTCCIILAGGKGSRFIKGYSKPLFPLLGTPAIFYLLDSLSSFDLDTAIIVSSTSKSEFEKLDINLKLIEQDSSSYGTGAAVLSARDFIMNYQNVLIVQGDDPLLSVLDLKHLTLSIAEYDGAAIGFANEYNVDCERFAVTNNLITDIKGGTDSGPINLGRYIFKPDPLLAALDKTSSEDGEIKLTSAIRMLSRSSKIRYLETSEKEFINMNSSRDAIRSNEVLRKRIVDHWIDRGVYIERPESVFISKDSVIASGTIIEGETRILGNSKIGRGHIVSSTISNSHLADDCYIENSKICDSTIGECVKVIFSYVQDAIIKECSAIGPYARLRPGAVLEENVKIGNFVEVKNSILKKGTKAMHHAYLGDAAVGEDTNIGCGVISANFNGREKNKTSIGDRCFIGSNVVLVAPVKVGDDSFIAANSTITEDVKSGSLAIARSKQTTKNGRAREYLAKR